MSDPVSFPAQLEESLRRRFRVVETDARLGDRALAILHPANAEELIDEEDFTRDERLPYWADLWPSARVLAGVVLRVPGTGRSFLELGCGSGLVTTCAAVAEFREVVASDYYEDAIDFARVNAWRNARRAIAGRLLDWRHPPAELPRYDVVAASDVLYERAYGPLVADVIAMTLAPHGRAIVADPGRVGREAFLQALGARGLVVTARSDHRIETGAAPQTITVFDLTWPAPS